MNENSTWQWLRDVALPLGQYSRIESPDTAPGFPDIAYQVGPNRSGTIELKYSLTQRVPFPSEDKGLHRSQRKWIRANLKYGGTVWIIAEVPPMIFVISGSDYLSFNGAPKDALFNMSYGVLYRNDPKDATKILHELLIGEDPNK